MGALGARWRTARLTVLTAAVPVAAVAAGLAVVFAAGETEVRDALRVVGWRGA